MKENDVYEKALNIIEEKKNKEKFIRLDERHHFVFLGSKEDSLNLKRKNVVGWTSHSEVAVGDRIFFYITSPISAIIATGIATGHSWENEDFNSRWAGRLMTEAIVFQDDLHIPIKELRELFPEWKWLRFPRQNTRIPHEVVKPFLELIEG